LKARSGSYYLKIQVSGKPTIVIFDTQFWLIDYITAKLDIDVFERIRLKRKYSNKQKEVMEQLGQYCTNENYYAFRIAWTNVEEIKNNYDSFFDPVYASYDPSFYDPLIPDKEIDKRKGQ
jgi:predicted glycosyltransferase